MKPGNIYRSTFILAILFSALLFCSCELRPSGGEVTLEGRIERLKKVQNTEMLAHEQTYFRDSINVDSLRYSPLWNDYIGTWVASFNPADSIVPASEKLLERVAEHYPQAFKPLVRDICRALKDRGARQTAIEVASMPYGIDPAQNPQIASRLLISTLLIGQPAPPLTVNGSTMIHPGSDGQQTILFFYESRCRSCQAMIWRLMESYGELRKSGISVITLSSDTDPELFAEHSRQFPWKEKLCDLLGFHSPAFVSYGVAGTPALFLIDEKGIVSEQYDSVEVLLDAIKDKK